MMSPRLSRRNRVRVLISLLIFLGFSAQAAIYSAPPQGSRLLGFPMEHRVAEGQSLDHVAQQYDMGLLAMMAANPGVDPFLPPTGSTLTLPSQMLLPDVERRGVVINLAELRLYYFDNARGRVYVYPIGIGRVGRETPLVKTKISQRIKDPTWTPTANTRKEWLEERGIELPRVVPAGPDNPMGHRALRLSYGNGEYLIHGTNHEFGIGMRVSAGCIRMRPTDIEELFELVRVGEPVRIINEPIKISGEPNGLYVEVHEPLSKNEELDKSAKTLELSAEQVKVLSAPELNDSKIQTLLREQRGLPMMVN
ncbi:L,D-transpeptidase family protein [Ferrimonas balearica]|nr:L,D-transpeptidase family protein [Ferrimonas balearica]MBW3138920.1 L,D-transpeptidase family protein [Ferrimonas balearica]MBW3163488.1 L,D-transpeptidase family protein [Ferrimonas balearica]MBY5979703.1 L,D-transpeptidase family protein [Ferrimonas balearica]MBY6105982.1 L,D-transpeptidase family protein [Ferrimonas balearica]MBY6223437.1 L,D-transpeptidase family protein [Ferrimonas balearica]